ncbi:polyketide synthase [Actinomadura rubrisoli]|uniref:Polyketide synthase n=1 Tax=Actinomadura rubrisoli TaxID=2530368 RepID=A0A4R5BAR3_9ACTN|nr:polyketide synthase [Actinomadura rubrisoli]TDD80532.1 polyketide synthase [Actinomadura rubrisoli]
MTNPEPDPTPGAARTAREPIAIVGIAGLYPGARGADGYWGLLRETRARALSPGACALADLEVDVARFGIPPAQRRSMTRMQVLMLEAARQCLTDAGYAGRPLATDRTDVIVGTCFGLDRQYANALRVEGARYARELGRAMAGDPGGHVRPHARRAARDLRARLVKRLGAAPHDRVGEMASTIPARIAGAFRLRGRTMAVESADATSFVALEHAVNALRGHVCDAVLVLAGQRRESPLLADALAAKGLGMVPGGPSGGPCDALGEAGFVLGEGVGALLLKRRSSAVRDGDRVYASIRESRLAHDARPGVLRYSTSAEERHRVALACHEAGGVAPGSVQYVEFSGGGVAAVAEAAVGGLGRLFGDVPRGSVVLGCAGDRLGNTFANAGLASVSKAALALYHRGLPPHRPGPDLSEAGLVGTAFRFARSAERWAAGPGDAPRRVAVSGASLAGTLCHLILEEHDSRRPAALGAQAPAQDGTAQDGIEQDGTAQVVSRPEAIAVVGFGGRFAGCADADAFWRTVRSGEDRIGPLPGSVLDRELYFAPDGISLTHTYTELGAPVRVPDGPPAGLPITPRRYAAMDAAQRVVLAVAQETLGRHGRRHSLAGRPGLVAIGSNLSLGTDRRLDAGRSAAELEAAAAELDVLADLPGPDRARILDEARRGYGARAGPLSPADLDGALAGGVAALVANEYRLAAVPVAVEAACASSLAALDAAIGALRSGGADYAIAGGVELACNPRDMVLCSALGLLSRTRITPFDEAADGFSPGDGCALFLLKRLSDARADGDPVFGLLRGAGGSNDARSLIAPDVDGQVRAMQQAFGQVEFDPAAVDYLEAHGTGTRVGDQVETTATAQVYAKPGRHRPLMIGTAKSQFGHTFAAAGGAGLLRALLSIRARTFPPNANLGTPGPELALDDIPARLPTEPVPWPAVPGRPRRAGVSSFGTGGINYHVLLEEHPAEERQDGAR